MAQQIEVYGREEIAAFRSAVPWAGISIATDHGDWPELDRTNCLGLLQLHFADLEDPHPGERLFDERDARRVLDFVGEVWPQIQLLVIHCQAGLRRSPAVAAAVSRIYFGNDSAWFQRGVYEPNMLVYETLLNVARQRGLFLQPRNPRRKRPGGKG
jgi:protein-tyrosine phosphatase